MSDTSNTLGEFPAATVAQWRALVEKTLKGAPFDSLQRTTLEGLPIDPLYDGDIAAPGFAPRPHDAERPWDIRSIIAHPDPVRANAELLADLEGGAASALIVIDPASERGVAVGSAEDLGRVLDGVMLEFAPAALDAGFLGPKAADWLAATAKSSPTAAPNAAELRRSMLVQGSCAASIRCDERASMRAGTSTPQAVTKRVHSRRAARCLDRVAK
jgi:methylmalonyl-CoA mutase